MSKNRVEKAAAKAAKRIKELNRPTKKGIEAIYRQFQAEVNQYSHKPQRSRYKRHFMIADKTHTSQTQTHTSEQTFRDLRITAVALGIEGWAKMRKDELQQALEAQR